MLMHMEEVQVLSILMDFSAVELKSHLVNCSVSHTLSVIHCRHFEDAGVSCPSGELELSLHCALQLNIICVTFVKMYV